MARRKEIERHLSSEELDDAIDTAQSEGDAYLVRRLTFVKNLYQGDSANQAGERVGVSSATASRWVRAWNDAGVEGLERSFSSGRPSKLSAEQRDRLIPVLKDHQPLTTSEVQQLIEAAFDVSYSKRHVSRLLRDLGLTYAIPRPEHGDRPDDAEDRLDQRLQDALDDLEDDELATDGGPIVGFLDEAWPQPTDNYHRLWAFDTPTLRKEIPTDNFDDAVFGFYALNGESVVACKPDVTKESVGEFVERIRNANPDRPIILICDNFSSHFAEYVNSLVEQLGITRGALPKYSPDLNPIEQIWKCVRRDLSPQDADDLDAFRQLIADIYHRHAAKLSFVQSWIDRFLPLQKLRP